MKFEDLDVWKRPVRLSADIGLDIGYIDSQQGPRWIKESLEIPSMLSDLIKSQRNHLTEN